MKRVHRKISTRIIGALVAAGLASAALAGCSASSPASTTGKGTAAHPSQITFWGWVPGLPTLVKQFNDSHKTIHVTYHDMTAADGQKIQTDAKNGIGPDVVQVSSHELPYYVGNGLAQDITQYVKGDKSKFTAASWQQATVNGKVYGVPQGVGPTALLYRKDIFAQYGIAVPKTWTDFVAAAKKLHAANPNVYIANISPSEIGQWVQEVQQAQGTWFSIDKNAWKVSVNGTASMQVAARWQELIDDNLVTTDTMWTPQYWADVNSGKIASIEYAAWFPVSLEQNAAKTTGLWRVAPQPEVPGSNASGDSGGAADIVLKKAKDPAAAATFVSWLNASASTQTTFIKVGGLFPGLKSGLSNPALKASQPFFGGQVINDVFADAAKNTPSTWVDGPNYDTVVTSIEDQFAQAVNKKITFAQALDNAQQATIADLKSKGISVAK